MMAPPPQASLSMAPVNIFRHGADEEKAETARLVGSGAGRGGGG